MEAFGPGGSSAFGFVVPGRVPVYSEQFTQIEALKWSCDVENSNQIRDVVVFLTQPLAAPGCGVGCFITGPPFDNWHFVGSLSNESPSGVFRVRWPPEEGAPTACRIGVSIMPVAELQALEQTLPGTELVDFGRKVANDLWNYLGSFEVMQTHGAILMPLFNRWMVRFEDRCKHDPFWWLNRS
mmetsp:Transcript_20199/g.39199  ORF Transcript_20199/g.39199 Transcript_20199/m.39199 type:complete len:183 (+) Transcript_20199:62-610(+)